MQHKKRYHGLLISVQTATCTSGQHHFTISQEGQVASQCSRRKVCSHNSLASQVPSAAADWGYEAHSELGAPEAIVANSSKGGAVQQC